MLYYTADARDGFLGGGASCNTCCCEPLRMRPGETNLLQINYAPWSMPIGYPGIIPSPEFHFEDTSTCPQGEIDNFGPPNNSLYDFTTPSGTPLIMDLSANATPVGNTFQFELVPLSGPRHGAITLDALNGQGWTYTPNAGFAGYDSFYYKTTDAQGRSIIRSVRITVGTPQSVSPFAFGNVIPAINPAEVLVNQRMQLVDFPIFMPYSAAPCNSWRLTIRQPAKDCDGRLYNHFMCFDLSPAKC